MTEHNGIARSLYQFTRKSTDLVWKCAPISQVELQFHSGPHLLKHMWIVSAKSIMQLAEQEQLSVFLQLVRSADLEDAFENFGEYTVFAPSESAMYGKWL